MRVISGSARGRNLKAVPGTNTRPTTDKVKEAIFSMIGPYFDGGNVLDLFAGTGGLGIEALSRGMDAGVFVDADRKSIEIVRENLRGTGMSERAEVYCNDSRRAIKKLGERAMKFDLVFLDPPYKQTDMNEWIERMEQHDLFGEQAVAVVEHDAKVGYPEAVGTFRLAKRAEYGDTAVTVYRREAPHS